MHNHALDQYIMLIYIHKTQSKYEYNLSLYLIFAINTLFILTGTGLPFLVKTMYSTFISFNDMTTEQLV